MKPIIHFVLDALLVAACCGLLILCFAVWREAIRSLSILFP